MRIKTALKNLATVALAIVALTWPSPNLTATEEEGTEDVGGREAQRRLELQDENGQIAPDAWINTYQQKDAMPFLPEAWSEFSSAAQIEAGIAGGVWTSIGPGNIGGRIRSLVIDPRDPETIWVGGVSGGVWKTTNGGHSWNTNTDSLANLSVSCMVMDPTDSNILYAGTGGDYGYLDNVLGNGIFKTTDGGAHWIQLHNTRVTSTNRDFLAVHRLAMSQTIPPILLAATATGIFRSTDGGGQWSRSTGYQNGLTWSDIRFKPVGGTQSEPPDLPPSIA